MTELTELPKERCTGCGACAYVCPVSAIEMVCDDEGFLYPRIDERECCSCNKCCETHVLSCEKREDAGAFGSWGMKSKDEDELLSSSSGGVFSLLADLVLRAGGMVIGAAFDEGLQLRHVAVESKEDLSALRGSKYLQSRLDMELLSRIDKSLLNGVPVLFSGTPCQVAGIKACLSCAASSLLLTVDLACHGVPSQKIFDSYINELSSKHGRPISYSFRGKSGQYAWSDYYVCAEFENGDSIARSFRDSDPFGRAFIENLTLRPSCYECSYRGGRRVSDITLGDYWGAERLSPSFYDIKGLSIVMANTNRGAETTHALAHAVNSIQIDANLLVETNAGLGIQTRRPAAREAFLADLMQGAPFSEALQRSSEENHLHIKLLARRVKDLAHLTLSKFNSVLKRNDSSSLL